MTERGVEGSSAGLAAEAAVFCQYLVGRAPQRAWVDRYVAACRVHFTAPPSARDAALLSFCVRHPRAVPLLDAAAGLLAGDGLLRRKILLMASLLEATPECAPAFVPRPTSAPGFVARATGLALLAACEAAAGAVLFVLVGGLRR